MRICLLWKEGAGGGFTLQEITALIERAGHQVARVIERADELVAKPARGYDCVVAAGGDGTVARAGRVLAGGDMPLAILPLGTANNIATSLGVKEDPGAAVAAWNLQQVVRVDVGVVHDAHGQCVFLEGVGVGLLPAGIAAGRKAIAKRKGEPSTEIAQARKLFLDTLMTLEPRRYGLKIEGTTLQQDSLLVEVLNVPCVGPRIRLSDEANPADGMLSVVVGGVEDRALIADHLRGSWNGDAQHAQLKTWRATRVEVGGWHDYHVDDEVRVAHGEPVTIHVEPGALPVLA